MDIDNCDNTIKYEGLPGYWGKFFSCHSCSGDKIPVVAFEAKTVNTVEFKDFIAFRLDQNDDWSSGVDTSNGSSPHFCLTNSIQGIKTALSLTVDDSLVKVVQNCGGYFLNLKYTASQFNNQDAINANLDLTSYTDSKITLVCAFCKPGYEASYENSNNDRLIVTSCTAISQCDLT